MDSPPTWDSLALKFSIFQSQAKCSVCFCTCKDLFVCLFAEPKSHRDQGKWYVAIKGLVQWNFVFSPFEERIFHLLLDVMLNPVGVNMIILLDSLTSKACSNV